MARRSHYTCVDPQNPRAAGVCDRGGEVRPLTELKREMRWAGNRMVETGWLVCAHHMDAPHPQDRTLLLPADPKPVRNPRPFIDMPDPLWAVGILDVNFTLDGSRLG